MITFAASLIDPTTAGCTYNVGSEYALANLTSGSLIHVMDIPNGSRDVTVRLAAQTDLDCYLYTVPNGTETLFMTFSDGRSFTSPKIAPGGTSVQLCADSCIAQARIPETGTFPNGEVLNINVTNQYGDELMYIKDVMEDLVLKVRAASAGDGVITVAWQGSASCTEQQPGAWLGEVSVDMQASLPATVVATASGSSAPTASPSTSPSASPSTSPSTSPTTSSPTIADAAAAFQETPAGIAVFTVVPIIVILITIVILIIIIILVLVCLRKKKKKGDSAQVEPAEMVVIESIPVVEIKSEPAPIEVEFKSEPAAPIVVSVEEQIANECAAKYPLIKVDLAHGHLIPLKSLEFLPNSADPEEPELFDALLQQLGACMILANDHLPDERDIHLVIGGHTDCPKEKATTSYFMNLSNKRAESVKAHLMKMHPELDASHLYPKGYGGARPIPGAIVGEGDRPNMRITFEATVASAVDAIIAAEVVYEGLE